MSDCECKSTFGIKSFLSEEKLNFTICLQVHACLKKAENGGEYQRAPHSNRRPAFRKNGILLNTKRGSIVAPNSSKPSDQIKRRLGENLRYREKEEWDFNWLDFIFMGQLLSSLNNLLRGKECNENIVLN